MESLKREFLELLDKDIEFRYAVAGYLGLSEILKRLDTLAEEQVRLAKEQTELRREQTRLAEEQVKLREEQVRLREEQARLTKEQTKIWREIERLREDMLKGFERHDAELTKLREDFNKLREDFNKAYRQLDARLTRVERTLEKITLDIEDEARIIIKYRLREMGYDVEITSLILPELELNIYGAIDNLCILGEASVRSSESIIDELNSKIDMLRILYPDKLRPKILKVIYTSLAMPDLTERAEKENIWVLKVAGDIVKPRQF